MQTKETEQSLLGALIADPSMFHITNGLVTYRSFYTTKHQQIYQAIESLIRDDAPVNIVTLKNTLKGKVDPSDIIKLTNQPTGANAEYYARVVSTDYARRQATEALQEALYTINEGNLEDSISTVQRKLDKTIPHQTGVSDVFPSIVGTIERVADTKKGQGYIATGFGTIDRHASLRPGNLTMVAADPGAGKTSYLLCVARHIAKRDKRPLFFTLEMTREQILENIIAQELKLCHQDMINGSLTDEQIKMMMAKSKEFERLNMGVIDGRWSISKLRHKVITEARTKGVDLLIVDSLGKIKLPDGMSKTGDLYKIYDIICEELVDIAVELNIPILLAHHLNKDSGKREKNNRPTLGSLNQAGERWTHNVILMHREYLHTKDEAVENEAEFIIGKARDGRVGIVKAYFDGPTKTFVEVDERC